MQIEDVVEQMNRNLRVKGIFVWRIAQYWGGVAQLFPDKSIEWNIVKPFMSISDMQLTLDLLEIEYETRKSQEAG